MKTVGEFSYPYEAQLAQGRLENEGIMCEVINEFSSYPCVNFQSPIRLLVNDEDYDSALKILAADSNAE